MSKKTMARKARMIVAEKTDGTMPPPTPVELFVEETVLLPKRVSEHVGKCWQASAYHNRLSRHDYLALLVEAACNHEDKLRDEEAKQGNLVQVVSKLPPGMAEAAKRLQEMKDGK